MSAALYAVLINAFLVSLLLATGWQQLNGRISGSLYNVKSLALRRLLVVLTVLPSLPILSLSTALSALWLNIKFFWQCCKARP